MNRITLKGLFISSVAALPLLVAAPVWAQNMSIDDMTVVETVEGQLDSEQVEDLQTEPVVKDYSVNLRDATQSRATQTLDWRTKDIELRFDLSESFKIEDLMLTLSADPLPGVDPSVPLAVQFNGGRLIDIPTNGQGFDTEIKLDRTRARVTGNIIRLSYAARCDASNGGYRIKLGESSLNFSASVRDRRLQLRDVEHRFASRTFAPKTIGLVASGDAQTKLQALAAQGVGLRMDRIPDFKLSASEADFDLIMIPRSQLADYTQEPDILDAAGPQIALSRTETNRLFLTGDTEADVLDAVQAFAQSSLPQSRRSETSPEEVRAQSPLDVDRRLIETTANLDLLTVQTGALREYNFDVTDPAAAEGLLVLRLNRGKQTQKGTRLRATLNGEDLGEAKVRGRHKTVEYPIRRGLLLGTGNQLELVTEDANKRPRCDASAPFIAIAEGSELRLSTDYPTPSSDLSRFAANGSLFSEKNGEETVLVLPERDLDFMTSLSVVAKLAQASGQGWVNATFERGETERDDLHRLIIEPYADIERHYRLSAPRGLQSAWRGQSFGNETDQVEQFASLDGEATVRQAAYSIRTTGLIQSGGVAALYPDESGRLIGVISNTADSRFASAMAPLTQDIHWNGLKGAVTRWNNRAVMMAQAAIPMPDFGETEIEAPALSLTERAKAMASQLAEVELPRPNVDGWGGWIDTHWTGFSDSVRTKSEAVDLAALNEAAQDKLSQTAATTQAVLDSPQLAQVRQSTQEVTTGLQGKLNEWDVKAASLRSDFWRHLDMPDQSMKAARLGQAQIIPIALGLAILFLMILVGLAFAAPMNGRTRPRRSQNPEPIDQLPDIWANARHPQVHRQPPMPYHGVTQSPSPPPFNQNPRRFLR